MARCGLVVLVVAGLCVLAGPTSAQEAPLATADEAHTAVSGAQTDLDAALAQTAVDCSAACVALASMQRAAERLCELEPGPRCDTARKRVEAARQRVAERCPSCEALREHAGNKRPVQDPAPRPPPVDGDDDDGEAGDAKGDKTETTATEHEERKAGGKDEVDQVMLTGAPANAPPSEESTAGCAACRLGAGDDPRGLWALVLAAIALGLRRR